MSRLGVSKRLEEDEARTADLNWSKGYSLPYHIMLGNKTGVAEESWEALSSRVDIAQRLAGHRPTWGRW